MRDTVGCDSDATFFHIHLASADADPGGLDVGHVLDGADRLNNQFGGIEFNAISGFGFDAVPVVAVGKEITAPNRAKSSISQYDP